MNTACDLLYAIYIPPAERVQRVRHPLWFTPPRNRTQLTPNAFDADIQHVVPSRPGPLRLTNCCELASLRIHRVELGRGTANASHVAAAPLRDSVQQRRQRVTKARQ